jgi:hypothetical protein
MRAPAQAGQDSERMADSIPTASRTVFRRDGGQFLSVIGTLSGMLRTVSAMTVVSREEPAGAIRRKP